MGKKTLTGYSFVILHHFYNLQIYYSPSRIPIQSVGSEMTVAKIQTCVKNNKCLIQKHFSDSSMLLIAYPVGLLVSKATLFSI